MLNKNQTNLLHVLSNCVLVESVPHLLSNELIIFFFLDFLATSLWYVSPVFLETYHLLFCLLKTDNYWSNAFYYQPLAESIETLQTTWVQIKVQGQMQIKVFLQFFWIS